MTQIKHQTAGTLVVTMMIVMILLILLGLKATDSAINPLPINTSSLPFVK